MFRGDSIFISQICCTATTYLCFLRVQRHPGIVHVWITAWPKPGLEILKGTGDFLKTCLLIFKLISCAVSQIQLNVIFSVVIS